MTAPTLPRTFQTDLFGGEIEVSPKTGELLDSVEVLTQLEYAIARVIAERGPQSEADLIKHFEDEPALRLTKTLKGLLLLGKIRKAGKHMTGKKASVPLWGLSGEERRRQQKGTSR